MDAMEWVRQDMRGDDLTRCRASRKRYYCVLRRMLAEEIGGSEKCDLLEHLRKYLQQDEPRYMYLLDAAALWECHEVLLEGMSSFRDAYTDWMPDIVQVGAYGERLRWNDVQGQSDAGRLPAAVLDEQLRIRLQELADYAALPPYRREELTRRSNTRVRHAQLNPRAKLLTAKAESVKRAQTLVAEPKLAFAPGWRTPVNAPPQDTACEADLRRQLADCRQQIAVLQQENADFRAQLARASAPADETTAVAELILQGRLTEAGEKAVHLEGRLRNALQQLETQETTLAALQEQLDDATAKLDADRLQEAALRERRRVAEETLGEVRRQSEAAQQAAAAALAETQAAEDALREARESLNRTNKELRELQRRKMAVNDADTLMRRQIGRY